MEYNISEQGEGSGVGVTLVIAEVFTLLHVSWFTIYPLLLVLNKTQVFFAMALVNTLVGILVGARLNSWRKGLLVCLIAVVLGVEMNTTPVPVLTKIRLTHIENMSRLIYFLSSTLLGLAVGLLLPKRWQIGQIYKPAVCRRVLLLAIGYGTLFLLFNQLPMPASWQFILVFVTFLCCSVILIRGRREQILRSLVLYVATVFTLIESCQLIYRLMLQIV